MTDDIEDLLRREAPQVLGALVRRYDHFHLAEEAVQEALLEAARSWGAIRPERPRAWLIRVAQRRLLDALRSERARAGREERIARETRAVAGPGATADAEPSPSTSATLDRDDSLDLLVLCCHPAVTPASAVALTLRAVGGLTTEEIASAFLVPTTTMGQRISRAKATIEAAGARFTMPTGDELERRLNAVLTVLYLTFNEGYASSRGESLTRSDLSAEAIRLTRLVVRQRPEHAEAAGLLALELLAEARRDAREHDGIPVPLDEQDRSRWGGELIEEGALIVEAAMRRGPLGRYQLQAAIAAAHCTAASAEETDWREILALYDLLTRYDDSPVVRLSRIVALARVAGPADGLAALDRLAEDPRLTGSHRVTAVRAHLLRDLGDVTGAVAMFRAAARGTRSLPEQRYLTAQAARLEHGS